MAEREVQVRVDAFADLDPTTAYRLWRLREQVFVVEQECAYPELDGRDLEPGTRHLWVAGDNGEPVAYLRLLLEPDGARRVGRVLTARSHRSQGLAAVLVERALDLAAGGPVVLDAQSHLRAWYERFGFEVCGREFLDDGIPHLPMRLAGGAAP